MLVHISKMWYIHTIEYYCLFFFFFFFGYACSMWKCPGQGSNPYHSSNLSQSSHNSECLSHCTTRELLFTPKKGENDDTCYNMHAT